MTKIIREDIEQRFISSPTTEDGGYVHPGTVFWKELSDSYLNNNPKRKKGRILIDTGRLRDSFIYEDMGENLSEYNPEEFSAEVGSKVPYAKRQDRQRNIMVDHPELEIEILSSISDFFMNEV